MKKLLAFAVSTAVIAGSFTNFAFAAEPSGVPAYIGLGAVGNFREGPGADDTGTPVYTFNYTYALALFDGYGKILDVESDILEVSTPNYDGASMPHFSGWPTTPGYNTFDHATGKIVAPMGVTVESATAEIAHWKTKRERGDTYGMKAGNDWHKQMDYYENWFKGKSVAEIKDWFAKNTTAAGRPIKAETTNEADKAKLAKLTQAEKTALADVVSHATMSLEDPHGLSLTALDKAYKNKVALGDLDVASIGLGNDKIFRNGPGKDEAGNPVYSVNVVTTGVAFDSEGKICSVISDILEFATDNYDGKTMPRFLGWPGTPAYPMVTSAEVMYPVKDGDKLWKIAEINKTTIENIMALNPQIKNKDLIMVGDTLKISGGTKLVDVASAKEAGNSWQTKRERGDAYGMNPKNEWYKQMDFFQKWMVGKSVPDLKAWFAKNTTAAGRPIKADTTNEADKAKLAALTDAEKSALADVVSGATMSIEDPHGKTLSAVAYAQKVAKSIAK